MKKYEEQKHFLSLMARPKDYCFIDISSLDIAFNYNPQSLSEIDSFTMSFTAEEIMASIKRANIVSEPYLNGTLVIADNQKHNPLPVIDKVFYNNFQINLFLKEICEDKEAKNSIINKFQSLSIDEKVKEAFTLALKVNDIDKSLDILFSISYFQLRKFVIYLISMRNRKKEKEQIQELKRDKAA